MTRLKFPEHGHGMPVAGSSLRSARGLKGRKKVWKHAVCARHGTRIQRTHVFNDAFEILCKWHVYRDDEEPPWPHG